MKILITGAGGTLGQSLVELLKNHHDVIGLEHTEKKVELLKSQGVQGILGDFGDWEYEKNPCDLVIHCAAYKHVVIGQQDILPFIENNIYKTQKLFAEAHRHNVDFIFISTDKAVEPTSLYGYTKAIGEHLCKYYDGYFVRLGNLIGSSGSVIPIWEQAIKEGRPLKITDKRMKRYMMTPEEAAKFIWESYRSGEKFAVPDIKEIKLIDLLNDLLKKHHKEDYPVEEIGARPGEKLTEKLKWPNEL